MSIVSTLTPYKSDYPQHLASYIGQIKEAIKLNKHHDHRRNLFINYLRLAYNVDPVEIEIEEKVKVANVRGNIDALFKFLIIEFKTNLNAERPAALMELKKYFSAQVNPKEYIAAVTNGILFELYQYEEEQVKSLSSFTLDEKDPISSYRSLDDILFKANKITPKSVDITSRFGPASAVFNKSRVFLSELFNSVKDISSVKVKFDEWNALLARVYGEPIGNDFLFLRHTYLTMFSRLLVANAIFPESRRTKYLYKGLLTGKFFIKNNLPNLAEQDFFSWALDTKVEDQFISFLSKLDTYLKRYKLEDIDEDIFKEIYQELIDPESRHSLGEYYTPDWIADLTLESLKYKNGKALDPACGSGTFLLAVIRRFRSMSISGVDLVNKAIDSIIGIDVHPVAVIMTKANILIGLAKEIKDIKQEIYLPVYLSDTLMTSEDKKTSSINISVSIDEEFRIPSQTTIRGINIDGLIDSLSSACKRASINEKAKESSWKGFKKKSLDKFTDHEIFLWKQNFHLLTKLINEGRDTIWRFILKNAYRPAYIRQNKVDYIIGNPPWLAYRYIKDKRYKTKVKDLTFKYKLLEKSDVKLFTQMDTSTLFFAYCEDHFLKTDGKIAFVLPKTTILPAKQHYNFQKRGSTELHDFSEVTPLFNVRSILWIKDKTKIKKNKTVKYEYKGRLPAKNLNFKSAKQYLTIKKTKHTFLSTSPQNSYYYPHFQQGATIVPRCFWFIQKDKESAIHSKIPYLETSDETFSEAKEQWKIKIQGRIEKQFIYETILAKDLLPFALIKTEPVFLPVIKQKKSIYLADSLVLLENGFPHSSSWLDETENLWNKKRQSDDRTLIQWLNYNQKLTKQDIRSQYMVLYNTSGTNLTSSLYIKGNKYKNKFKTYGMFTDSVTYYYYPKSINEGYYLTAILNSDIINKAIKAFQPQGLFGERHIHRRPFEVCMIPKYDPKNKIHSDLAKLGKLCHEEIAEYVPLLKGRIGSLRLEVKRILKNNIIKINELVKKLLKEAGQNSSFFNNLNSNVKNGDLFK